MCLFLHLHIIKQQKGEYIAPTRNMPSGLGLLALISNELVASQMAIYVLLPSGIYRRENKLDALNG